MLCLNFFKSLVKKKTREQCEKYFFSFFPLISSDQSIVINHKLWIFCGIQVFLLSQPLAEKELRFFVLCAEKEEEQRGDLHN